MTTPHERLREAADIVGFVGAKDSYIDWAVSDKQRAAFQLAANTLRVIASAQSDAEKGYKSWFFENIRATEGVHVNSDGSTMMRSELIDQGYHAGHAQGVAAGIAAQEAKCAELERELRMYRDCADEEDEQQTELVDFFRKEFVREGQRGDDDGLTTEQCAIRVMREQSTALATAKADALDLANEVRRMDNIIDAALAETVAEDVKGHIVYCDETRPDTVTAAMGRYK